MKLLGIGSSLEVSGHVGVVTAIRGVRGKDNTVSSLVTSAKASKYLATKLKKNLTSRDNLL